MPDRHRAFPLTDCCLTWDHTLISLPLHEPFFITSSRLLHLPVVRCLQYIERGTYGRELADIRWGASRVSGRGYFHLQERSIAVRLFIHL